MGVGTFCDMLFALHDTGRDDALISALTDPKRPGYAQILSEGATFTWESWDARQTGDSESHGFGAGVLVVLQADILGVDIAAPGASQVDISTPSIPAMHANGVVPTQRGSIPIAWNRDANGHFSLDVTIPANVVATVHIPAASVGDVREGTRSVAGDPGVMAARAVAGEVVLTVGSGHYEFSASS